MKSVRVDIGLTATTPRELHFEVSTFEETFPIMDIGKLEGINRGQGRDLIYEQIMEHVGNQLRRVVNQFQQELKKPARPAERQ